MRHPIITISSPAFSSWRRLLVLVLLLGMVNLTRVPLAYAQTGTTNSTSSTTQNLKERIERVLEEKRDQVKGVLQDLSTHNRGFIGEVQRVSDEAVTIKSAKTTNIFALTDQVTLVKKGKKISVADISVGDWVLVLGTNKEDFIPTRLFFSSTTLRPKNKVVMVGTIKSLTKSQVVLIPRSGQAEKTFIINKTTSYQDGAGESLTSKDIDTDIQCLVIGLETDSGVVAKVIRTLTPSDKP